MFRRLACWFGLLLVALFAAAALVVPLLTDDESTRGRLWLLLGGLLALGLVGTTFVAASIARQVTRPLGELMRAVEHMGATSPHPRVFTADRDEVRQLGQTFNAASERLSARIAALEEERQQLRTILSAMVEGVVALDAEQRVLFVNDRARDLLDLQDVSPVGRPLWEAVRHRPLLDIVRQALESPQPCREEFSWNGAAVRSLTVHAAGLPGAPPRGAVLVLHDTTDLRRLERLRQDFVANVSHELKTPLSVIKVCGETLLDGALEDAANRGRFVAQIARQADRLHALILDLLSLARIESGDQLFDFDAVALASLVQGCVERQRPRAEARSQRLIVEGPSAAVLAWADEEALDQILENLLDNALKYTPEGGEIRVHWGERGGQAWFEVSDTGIGIPEPDLPRIFERFYRVDKARSREMGGTGLGLSIVKHLVGAMQGTVSASSQVGRGTTFTVQLPLARG